MNKAKVRELRAEINSALEKIGAKHNMSIKTTGTATYDTSWFRVKLECKELNADGVDKKTREDWNKYCKTLGFQREDFGKEFRFANQSFKISGLKMSRPKFPISAVGVHNGRGYKFDAETVSRLIK